MKPFSDWNPGMLLQSPLFEPLYPVLARLSSGAFPTLCDCNDMLAGRAPSITTQNGKPLRFVAQEHGKLPFEAQYEPRCYLRGEVQTREHNWHDLFNALAWLTFPQAKAAINARHYRALINAAGGGTGARGSERDMLTLLDESGVIVVCADAELGELLRGFQWKELFWRHRERVKTAMGFYPFGHGLYEKALKPYVGMTGQGLLLVVEPGFFAWPLTRRLAYLDELLAEYLAESGRGRSTRELTPVPLLGVPGWSEESKKPVFYDNYSYFRTRRLSFQQKNGSKKNVTEGFKKRTGED
jgi:hypothetical protein